MKKTAYINMNELIEWMTSEKDIRITFQDKYDIVDGEAYIDYDYGKGWYIPGTLVIDYYVYKEFLEIGGIEFFKEWVEDTVHRVNRELDEPYHLEIR